MNNNSNCSVSIFLCTYNSNKHLKNQLASIFEQSYLNWRMWISVDGSQDDTAKIIDEYIEQWGKHKIALLEGPQQGFALNFFSLINNANIQEDYYAYSDHDDVWMKHKLERAINFLKKIPEDTPARYCSRTCLVDEELNKIGFSPIFNRPPSFANAIVQNIGGGNTMVFNHAARGFLQKLDLNRGVVSHDRSTYRVVTACGGNVFYDKTPTVSYQQHEGNTVGANRDFLARLYRLKMLYKGHFKNWNEKNIQSLRTITPYFLSENIKVLDDLIRVRDSNLFNKILNLKKLTVDRQTFFSG
jgi:glycosyltransferase involved in cell wall biosynthesis